MSTKHTFTITRTKDGKNQPAEEIEYTPMRVFVGGKRHILALHQLFPWGWIVSDPKSGGRVLQVHGTYKGIRVSSKGMTLADVKLAATSQVIALAARVGEEKFNQVLAEGRFANSTTD
jgi:hypothetical protein